MFTTLLVAAILSAPPAEKKKDPIHERPIIVEMLKNNNEYRKGKKLKPMKISPELTKAAQGHADFMARTGGYGHYTNGSPAQRAANAGFSGYRRENIAAGQTTVKAAFAIWIGSTPHRANLESNTTHCGFGFSNERGWPYWVAMYGVQLTKEEIEAAKKVAEVYQSQPRRRRFFSGQVFGRRGNRGRRR